MQTPGNHFARSNDTSVSESSPVTPFGPRSTISEDFLKTPPLFSQEERDSMAREKDQLQTEVAVLGQRLVTLQTEARPMA